MTEGSLQHVARQPGSNDDLGPFLNVITWILLVTSALAILTRLITKRALKRRIDVDDAFAVAAMITSIGSGTSVSIQTANGLGRDFSSLAESQVMAYEKSEYANGFLYIATLVFAKLSIIYLLMILTASELHRKLGLATTAVIALWGIVSLFIAAFQCGPHRPSNFLEAEGSCLNLPDFWRAMGVLNILTDLALILFPVHVIATLQMSIAKKFTILIFFSARLLDVLATAVQIAYTPAFSSRNPTRDLWKWTLTTQVIECITILTSCVPYLRPLLESLPSGLYGSDEIRRRGTSSDVRYSRSKSVSYHLSSTTSASHEEKGRQPSQVEMGFKRFLPVLAEASTSHSNSASGIPGGPRRTDGEIDVEISGPKASDVKKWEMNRTGSEAKIMKTTVVSAAWEAAQRRSREASGNEFPITR